MADLEKVKAFFKNDIFAMDMGIEIVQADEEESVCTLDISPKLYNAGNTVQGGAVFTLADLAFAVAANCEGRHTVTQNATVNFLKPGKGKKLIARATKISAGKTTCHYSVRVTNEEEVLVAHMTVNGYIIG